MTPVINNQLELLQQQLACVFRFVNDRKVHRSKFRDFDPVQSNGNILQYRYDEATNGRSSATIDIFIEHRRLSFIQNYNYGVMLNVHVMVSERFDEEPKFTIAEFVNNYSTDEGIIIEVMVDFEYALSLVTTDIAEQVHRLGN